MIAAVAPVIRKPSTSKVNLLEYVSASRLSTVQQCKLKFYFRYVLGLSKPRTPALHVGSTVHSVLQEWSLMRWRTGKCDMDHLKRHFASRWEEDEKESKVKWDDGEEESSKQAAWALLEAYWSQTPIALNEKPEAVEVSVDADLTSHGLPRLVGIIDLVRPGGRIVDFKTSAQTPNAERAGHLNETQLSCYSVLYRAAVGKNESGLELHHLVKLKTPKLVVTALAPTSEQQLTRLFRVMESYVSTLHRQDWIPSPNPMSCVTCEFFNECRRWP